MFSLFFKPETVGFFKADKMEITTKKVNTYKLTAEVLS